jgi:hypothetical protein
MCLIVGIGLGAMPMAFTGLDVQDGAPLEHEQSELSKILQISNRFPPHPAE